MIAERRQLNAKGRNLEIISPSQPLASCVPLTPRVPLSQRIIEMNVDVL